MVHGAIALHCQLLSHNETLQPTIMIMAAGSFISIGFMVLKPNQTFSPYPA